MKAFLLTLSVLLACTRAENRPRVVLLPRYPSVYVGDDVSLKCKGKGDPVIWKLNGKELSHKSSPMVFTMVTPKDNGEYKCQRNNGEESDAYNLKVLKLEPYAQLSLPPGGAVVSRGDARVLTLQVYDGEVQKWKCYVFRNNSGFVLQVLLDGQNVGRVYADLENSQRATFWCKKTNSTHRSNVVTLMMTDQMVMLEPATPVLQEQALTLRCAAWGGGKVERADFYKDNKNIKTTDSDTYTISNPTENDSGQYKCSATYRYSHISSMAAAKTIESDPQQIKVIEGPPAALLTPTETKLKCSCEECTNCNTYQWHHIDSNTRIHQTSESIYTKEQGSYTCRAICDHGFSRFSDVYNHKGEPGGGRTAVVILVVILIILMGLISGFMAVITRRRNRNMCADHISTQL